MTFQVPKMDLATFLAQLVYILKVTSATKLFFATKKPLISNKWIFHLKKKNVSFTRYLDFCVFVKSTDFLFFWILSPIKMLLVSCTNAHHYVTDLVNHAMIKNTKTWISWEQNITFLQNKKFLICASDGTFWEVTVL